MSESLNEDAPAKRSKTRLPTPVIGLMVLVLIAFYMSSLAAKDKVAAPPPVIEVRGIVIPVDGDTVDLTSSNFDTRELETSRHRIWGIDAPDVNGSAGEYFTQSKAALAVAAQYEWICEDTGDRSRERIVSKCRFASNDEDIGYWIVRAGYAVDWPDFSGGAYAEAERLAKIDRVGIWQTYDRSWR